MIKFKEKATSMVELPIISMEETKVTPIYVAKMNINASLVVMANHLQEVIKKDSNLSYVCVFPHRILQGEGAVSANDLTTEYFIEVEKNPEEITIILKKREYKFS